MAILEKKKYERLTEETAVVLVKELHLFSETATLSCHEIGDGNLNYVFRITDSESGKGVIIKQALPYAKVIGEHSPLTLYRSTIEANALKKHGEFVPGLVPKIYETDEILAVTIMEDLSHLTIARRGFINGESYPRLSSDIGEYLARTLFYTSDFSLHPFEKKKLAVAFSNPELCKITEDLVLTDPFFDHESNDYEPELQGELAGIWGNRALKLEVAKLKKIFVTEAEALLHGDLHTGSIFSSEEETKVIDPEFAFYGPIGYDVGLFIGNLIFQAIVREGDKRDVILNHIENSWKVFSAVFSELWKKESVEPFTKVDGYLEHFLQKVFTDALGFAGCELIRRTVGLSHVVDLDEIENKEQRILAKKRALATGSSLILQRNQLSSIEAVISLLKENI